jgi:aminopeptidase N
MILIVEAAAITKGFQNQITNPFLVENGTFINNFSILPSIGYSESYELDDKQKRKKNGLPEKVRMPKLDATCSSNSCSKNYLSNGTSDWINVETYISTSSDQIAIAPGSLIKEWKEGGRNYYHYKVDHPSQNFFSFMSARYEVARKKWNGIDIEVYYDKAHAFNIEMMTNAVEKSLKYYTENFGPYYHKQARIIEFPRYSTFAQAFPGTMPYSESFGFITNLENENDNNVIDAVIAHEMAHQWWAHQVVGATMQGATMFSESFAEYSSLMVMKNELKDDMKMKNFLKYDYDRYLKGRAFEQQKELPLYEVENQQYIHYGKGSVILYALQDYIGEEKVNNAMRSFLEQYRYQKPPYPTSLDFLRHLEPQVPDSLNYLITDWFKEITLYDYRLIDANYSKKSNGKYEVTMNIEAFKLKADTLGKETNVAVNDWADIGVYADNDEENLMFYKRVKFDQEKMNFTFEVDSLPAKAAIDPRRILIERNIKDNVKSLTEKTD